MIKNFFFLTIFFVTTNMFAFDPYESEPAAPFVLTVPHIAGAIDISNPDEFMGIFEDLEKYIKRGEGKVTILEKIDIFLKRLQENNPSRNFVTGLAINQLLLVQQLVSVLDNINRFYDSFLQGISHLKGEFKYLNKGIIINRKPLVANPPSSQIKIGVVVEFLNNLDSFITEQLETININIMPLLQQKSVVESIYPEKDNNNARFPQVWEALKLVAKKLSFLMGQYDGFLYMTKEYAKEKDLRAAGLKHFKSLRYPVTFIAKKGLRGPKKGKKWIEFVYKD